MVTQVTNRLSQKAMLVHLGRSMYTGAKKDKNVTAETCDRVGAARDAGAWITYLIPKKSLKDIQTAYDKCYMVWRKYTLPWNDDGTRILPSVRFMEYTQEMREAVTAFDKAVDGFIKNDYPTIITTNSARLSKLLDGQKMPTAPELRSKFEVRLNILPIPDAGDFRVVMDDEDAEAIKKQVETSIHSMTQRAMADVWGKLAEVVEKLATTLGDKNKKFKNSLVYNITEFCQLLPKLNVTDDQHLIEMGNEVMSKLGKLKTGALRDNHNERKAAAKIAKELIEKMGQFM